jgi:hypothetical protein
MAKTSSGLCGIVMIRAFVSIRFVARQSESLARSVAIRFFCMT